MPGIGIGIGIGFGRGGPSLAGGRMAAVSGPAEFAAVGGTWTLGDLSPTAWFRPYVASGITLSATAATTPTVDAWATLTGLVRTTEGAWTCLTNDAGESVDHLSQTAVTNYLAAAPMGATIDLRRGAPPPGEASNLVRVYSGTAYVDVNLDTGAVVGGTHETCTITALGASPDDGYTVAPRFAYPGAGNTLGVSPLVGASSTFADAEGVGYFYARGGGPIQPRVASWADPFDATYAFATATASKQPVLWEDARGPCVVFTAASQLLGSAAVLALAQGAETPLSIALAADHVPGDAEMNLLAWRQTLANTSGHGLTVTTYGPQVRSPFARTSSVGWHYSQVTGMAAFPFNGAMVSRYDGATIKHRANGTNGAAQNVTAGSECTLTAVSLGIISGMHAGNVRYRELAIGSRGWTDTEAVTADAALRATWGY